jgi:tRNA A-37 threonylcarbamoyl transferase component Bud32
MLDSCELDAARKSVATAQAGVRAATVQNPSAAAATTVTSIRERDEARVRLVDVLQSKLDELRRGILSAFPVEAEMDVLRASTSQLEDLLKASRSAIADEAAARAVALTMDGMLAPLRTALERFDAWEASLSASTVYNRTEAASGELKAALVKHISKLFDKSSPSHVPYVSEEDITALTQLLFTALDAENGLSKSREGWVSSIPAGPLLRAAQVVIDNRKAAHTSWCDLKMARHAIKSELAYIESIMSSAEKEIIEQRVKALRDAKRTLVGIQRQNTAEAADIEDEIREAEREGAMTVTAGRMGSQTLPIDDARQRILDLRAAVREASTAVREASCRLAEHEPTFPELGVHLGSAELGVSSDLVPLWLSNWTLQTFESLALISSPSLDGKVSRNCIYKGTIGQEIFAVKEYKLDLRSLRTCMQEATLLKRAQHPHIAEISGLFWDPSAGSLCLMMPYYLHGQLDEWVCNCKPTPVAVRRALSQVLLALAHLHSHRIIHTDVKPANVLISNQGSARLADFNISVEFGTRVTYAATRVGFTAGFDAPELCKTGATTKTDMFAFGVTVKVIDAADSGDLVKMLCDADHAKRSSAVDTLQHDYFAPAIRWEQGEQRQCCVSAYCGGELVAVAEGLECSGPGDRHFVCRECFETLVEKAATEDLRLVQKREGRIICPSCFLVGSVIAFTDVDIARFSSSTAFEKYNTARMRLIEQRMASEFEEQLKQRLREEHQRLKAMDEEERRVKNVCDHINEEILTLKCPRPECKQAFFDFEGCFALSCSRCPCRFCGWCGADCGTDAHAHVRQCPHKTVWLTRTTLPPPNSNGRSVLTNAEN